MSGIVPENNLTDFVVSTGQAAIKCAPGQATMIKMEKEKKSFINGTFFNLDFQPSSDSAVAEVAILQTTGSPL